MEHRVLVVDDESWIRRNIRRILEKEGITVLLADSGTAALAVLKDQKVDMVLTDHRMPRMTGIELLEVVKAKYPGTLRVMLTGFADLQLSLDAINRVEVHRLLLKPYSRDQLVNAVTELLDLRAAGSEMPCMDLGQARNKKAALDDLAQKHPGIDQVARDRRGRVVLDHDDAWDTQKLWSDVADILGDDAPSKEPDESSDPEEDEIIIKIL